MGVEVAEVQAIPDHFVPQTGLCLRGKKNKQQAIQKHLDRWTYLLHSSSVLFIYFAVYATLLSLSHSLSLSLPLWNTVQKVYVCVLPIQEYCYMPYNTSLLFHRECPQQTRRHSLLVKALQEGGRTEVNNIYLLHQMYMCCMCRIIHLITMDVWY